MSNPAFWRAAIALGMVLALTAPALTQGKGKLGALSHLQPGLWQLRKLDDAAAPRRSICVANPEILMQLEHRGAPCSQIVVTDDASNATVHYTCPANGYGRTSVRVETPRLAKIDTQGIIGNSPFAYRAEARRVGACPRR